MTQSSNRIFDELARLATDAAGAAQGVRREVETVVRTRSSVS
jgi:BMFP domain-containing protein YqiC